MGTSKWNKDLAHVEDTSEENPERIRRDRCRTVPRNRNSRGTDNNDPRRQHTPHPHVYRNEKHRFFMEEVLSSFCNLRIERGQIRSIIQSKQFLAELKLDQWYAVFHKGLNRWVRADLVYKGDMDKEIEERSIFPIRLKLQLLDYRNVFLQIKLKLEDLSRICDHIQDLPLSLQPQA